MMGSRCAAIAVVALCAVAAAACGRTGAGSPTAITTPAATPSGQASITSNAPTPPSTAHPRPFTLSGVRACTASNLRVSVHVADPSYVNSGPMNTSFWDIDVSDIGNSPCFVGPTPNVSFYSAGGLDSIPKTQPWPGDIVYLSPESDPAPPYFGSATGEIDVHPCHLQPVARMRVDFGTAQGSVDVTPGPAGGWGTPCPMKSESYFTELYGLPNDGTTGGYAPRTQTVLTAPASAHPGETLRFLVTLQNTPVAGLGLGTPSPNPPMTFTPCPEFFDEIEGVIGTFHTALLDCAKAAPIPPDGTETFAMSIDVPLNAMPGPATLIWSLAGSPATYEVAHSYLVIT